MHRLTGRTVPRVLVLAAPVMILASSCDGPLSAPAIVASVVVSPGAATLVALDQRLTLHATAFTAKGDAIAGKKFVWSSSNDGIVPVDADGIVVANVDGTATITATVDGISGSATMTVAPVPVSLSFALRPNATYVNVPIGNIEVNVLDANRRTVYTAVPRVTLSLASTPPGTTLSGTGAVATEGIARFPSLTINHPGTGYQLVASAPGLTSGTSEPFDIASLSFRIVRTGAVTTCALDNECTPYCSGAPVNRFGDAPLPVAVGGVSRSTPSTSHRATSVAYRRTLRRIVGVLAAFDRSGSAAELCAGHRAWAYRSSLRLARHGLHPRVRRDA